MYSLKYKVTTSTCDSEGKLKLYSALQMMQDCSEMWIDSVPMVKRYFAEQNMAQLLATRQVEVVRVPEFKEELTVTTSVYEVKPMFGFRNTFIYDAKGRPCYKTWSMGAFVDKAVGKLKRVDDATIASMAMEPRLEMNYKDRRIILPKEGGEACVPVHVMRSDIDYNRHVNNANYIRIAMELLPEDAPQFVKDYHAYYKTPRGYHARSGNSNDGWRVIGTQAYANARFLYYINEIRSAVLIMHGAEAHSRYFGEAAYHYMVEGKAEGYNFVGKPNPNPDNKQLLIIPGATHCDLYDGGSNSYIPWDTLAEFFNKNL